MKFIVNPVTGDYESTSFTFRDRFSLGGDAQPLETKPEGQVAGALMDAFPKQSFLEYQNAVQEGYQGTMEEFLQMKSNKSELDMEAIEGQTAGALPDLIKLSSDVVDLIKKKNKKTREPQFSSISKTDGKGFKKLDEAEQLFKDELTKKFKNILNDPKTKNLIPKKYRNIKDIREIPTKDFQKINTDLRDFEYKKITDEKGIGKYSTLTKTQQNNLRALLYARNKSAALPKTNFINIAGDDFKIPNNIGVLPDQVKNLEKGYSLLKKFDKNPTVDNFYKEVTGQDRGGNLFINDVQAYLSGVDTRTRPIFDKPIQMQLLKSLDLENKLKPETIKILTEQKGKTASNRYKLSGMSEKAKKINLDNPQRAASVKRIDEIYKEDPNIASDELINQYYGNSFAKASIKEQKKMLGELRNDVVTYYKIINQARVPVKGVRLPSAEKRADILDSIEFQKGKGGFNIYGGYIRDIQNKIAESITGYNSGSRIVTLSKKYSKQGNVDHSVGLGAVHEVAPGYAEAIQIIKPSINKQKGRLLERPLTGILDDFFTDSLNKPRKIGGETYSNFDDKVAAYNNLSKEFANQNGVDTAIIKFSKPGTGPSPKETVTHFTEFSKGAQKNMMEVWNNHGLVIYTKSKPMRSESFAKTYKTNKNMGGMIEVMDETMMMAQGGRVNFENGTGSLSFSDTETDNFIDMAIAANQNDNIPIEDKTFLGMKLADNPLQRFNEMIDPRAYPYYGQKISEGASRIPEYAGRTIFAALQTVGDLIKGRRTGKMDRFVEAITPAATNKAQEAIGLTKLIEDTEKNRTGAQKQYGEGLEFLAEVPGPATPIGFLLKTPKYVRQLRGLTGSTQAAKELENKIQEKIAVDQGRRDFNILLGTGGVMAVVKALGLDKLIPVGSKVAQKTAPIVTQGGTPKYFFDFVNLIKKSGDDITEKASTLERQKVYDYNGYTMYEDMTTGEIRINKTNEGMASGTDEFGEVQQYDTITGQEEIIYRPGEEILGKDGKAVKTLDEYEEATAKPDSYGDMEGEAGLDSLDEILDLLSKDGKTYSKTQLQEMGINPEALGNYPTGAGSYRFEDLVKPKKAGGGIMKLAGDDSGPPPKSGPNSKGLNSEGLALILKRGRKY